MHAQKFNDIPRKPLDFYIGTTVALDGEELNEFDQRLSRTKQCRLLVEEISTLYKEKKEKLDLSKPGAITHGLLIEAIVSSAVSAAKTQNLELLTVFRNRLQEL